MILRSRRRRVQLAVPGSNAAMIEKASRSAADHVFLDLEDAVAPNAKEAARATVVEAIAGLDWADKTVCVRVNDIGTPWCLDDVVTVVRDAGPRLDTLMIPKAAAARDIHFFDTLLTQLETKLARERPIGLEILIEEVPGLHAAREIAAASARVECLILGMGDYAASHGIDLAVLDGRQAYPGDIWYLPRFLTVMAARSAGIDAIDGPYGAIKDSEGYRREAERARALGMSGKWALHPSQIDPALEIFTPRPEDVAMARRIHTAYAKAQEEGSGAIEVNGLFIDVAVARLFDKLLQRAEAIGV